MTRKRMVATLSLSLALCGCASIAGSPRAVIEPATMRSTVAAYPYSGSLLKFYGPVAGRQGLSRREYRDMILAIYLGAVDAEYYQFRQELSTSGRGSALGMDLLVLGLSGATAVASMKDMAEFAVAATVAGGARTALDKNLFFERTLPSVISAMDAERARVRVDIERKLDLDELRYPLPAAFNDVALYQLAGTLERGVQRVATVASADAAAAQEQLGRSIAACEVIEDISDENNRLSDALVEANGNFKSAEIKIAADALKVTEGATPADTYANIHTQLNLFNCTKSQRTTAVDHIVDAIDAAKAASPAPP